MLHTGRYYWMLSISIQDWEHSWRMGHFLLKNAKSQYVSRYRAHFIGEWDWDRSKHLLIIYYSIYFSVIRMWNWVISFNIYLLHVMLKTIFLKKIELFFSSKCHSFLFPHWTLPTRLCRTLGVRQNVPEIFSVDKANISKLMEHKNSNRKRQVCSAFPWNIIIRQKL